MVQSRSAFFGLGAFAFLLSMVIACGDDSAAPPTDEDNGDDSTSSSGGTGNGTGGEPDSGGTGGGGTGGGDGGTGGDPEDATATTTTTDAAGGTGAVMPTDTGLGDQCETDDDCEEPWTCLQPGDNVYQVDADGTLASIPGGVCTKECADGYDCSEDDDWSVCIGFSEDAGYCMPFCIPGDGTIECAGRADMVCNLLPTGDDGGACSASADCSTNQVCAGSCIGVFPACLPNCATDDNCPDGRFCDPATGACLEEEPVGAAVGEGCAEDADCASQFCVEGLCNRICTLGVDDACGTNGICIPLLDVTTDVGDRGRCLTLCDCPSDCENDACLSLQDDELVSLLGFEGFCGEVLEGDVELTCE